MIDSGHAFGVFFLSLVLAVPVTAESGNTIPWPALPQRNDPNAAVLAAVAAIDAYSDSAPLAIKAFFFDGKPGPTVTVPAKPVGSGSHFLMWATSGAKSCTVTDDTGKILQIAIASTLSFPSSQDAQNGQYTLRCTSDSGQAVMQTISVLKILFAVGGPRGWADVFTDAASAHWCRQQIASANKACQQAVQLRQIISTSAAAAAAATGYGQSCRCAPPGGPKGAWGDSPSAAVGYAN
jgi:hypothetical protein